MAPSFSLGQRSVSPANSTATTHLSPRPNALGSLMTPPGHAFTDPSRPLFSGYGLSPTSDGGSSSSGGSGGLNNWAKKQRDKDLRQAQRLEKALEEKISRLTRQLEWKPPVKREIGYGYGDGGEVPVEVTLLSGEKMRVLSEEERLDMEAEVKNAESSLNRVRVEIVQYGGVAGGPGSSVLGSEEFRSPSDEHARPLVSTPSVASPATLHSPSSNATLTENVEGSNLISRPSQSLLFTAFASDHALFARRGESDEGPSLLTPGASTIVAREVKPEDSPKKRDAPSQPPVPLTSSVTSSSDLSARSPALGIPPQLDVDAGSRVPDSSSVETSSQKATTTTDTTSSDVPSNLPQASGFKPSSPHQKVQSSPKEAIDENREQRGRDSSLWSRWGSVFSGNSSSKERNTPTPSATAAKSTMSSFDKLSAFMFPSGGRQSQKSLDDIASPITATPVQSVVSDPKDSAKQKRRISMSTAQPGEETSTQTMPSLNFDDSDDDDGEADDSREYVSAEEGFDDDNEDAISTAEQPHEVTTSDPKTAPIFVGASTSAQPIRGHMVQRKRSSTTTGISPPHEVNARPSLLDSWHFDFSSRQPSRDTPSGLPVSTMFGHSDNHRMPFGGHTRQTSRDSDTLTFRDGRRTATPNNTFSSPSVSGQSAPVSLQIRSFGESSIVTNNQRLPGSTAIQPSNANFSEIVTRSAKVLDDQANIIEYANARVMSGGVKIGDVLPRGTNGMIAEEDDDDRVTFEAVSPTRGQSLVPISGTAETAAHPASSYASRSSIMSSTVSTGLHTMGNTPLNNPTLSAPQGTSAPLGNVSTGQVASPMTTSLTQPSLAPVSPKAISQPPPLTTPVSLSTPSTVQKLSHTVQLTGINPGIRAPTSTVSSSPVTSQSTQFPGAPVEYCGDFRTTGYCRFGARCRYSHDIKPRVKSHTGTNKIYRPVPSLLSSPQRRDPLPLVPVGYNLSNVLPQPHHIPGVPLTQQLPSPFVFTPASSMAHPMTSPAATAAAQQGYLMTNPDQVNKILTSHALTPQQVLPHQPAPVVQADGEIMYDLTKGRSTETRELFSPRPSRSTGKSTASTTTSSELEKGKREAREMLAARFGTSIEAVTSDNPEISTVEGEDDIWTVSTERQHPEKDVPNDSKSGDQYGNKVASTQYGPDKYTRVYTSPHPPPSYSPVQHLQYARPHPHPHTGAFMVPHYPQLAQPPTVSTPALGGPTPVLPTPTVPLTQEEVIKMFASFGTNMIPPGSRVSHVSPSGTGYPVYTNPTAQAPNAAHVNPQGYPQHPRQSSAPYDYMYQPMPH